MQWAKNTRSKRGICPHPWAQGPIQLSLVLGTETTRMQMLCDDRLAWEDMSAGRRWRQHLLPRPQASPRLARLLSLPSVPSPPAVAAALDCGRMEPRSCRLSGFAHWQRAASFQRMRSEGLQAQMREGDILHMPNANWSCCNLCSPLHKRPK